MMKPKSLQGGGKQGIKTNAGFNASLQKQNSITKQQPPKSAKQQPAKKKEDDLQNILSENKPAFMRRPKTLVCYICGREYGTQSLKIHLKSCEQKWENEQQQKPAKDRRNLPKPPPGLLNMLDKDQVTTKDIINYNNNAFDQYNYECLEQCVNCGRTFKPESLVHHLKACKPGNILKPLPKLSQQQPQKQQQMNFDSEAQDVKQNLIPCSKCGRKFVSDRVDKHESACRGEQLSKKAQKAQKALLEKQKMYEKYDQIHKKPKSKWRQQHEQLLSGLQQIRNMKTFQEKGGNLKDLPPPERGNYDHYVQCDYCGRKYSESVAERHIPKCKNIINKPKPPPQMSSYTTGKRVDVQPQMKSKPQQQTQQQYQDIQTQQFNSQIQYQKQQQQQNQKQSSTFNKDQGFGNPQQSLQVKGSKSFKR